MDMEKSRVAVTAIGGKFLGLLPNGVWHGVSLTYDLAISHSSPVGSIRESGNRAARFIADIDDRTFTGGWIRNISDSETWKDKRISIDLDGANPIDL